MAKDLTKLVPWGRPKGVELTFVPKRLKDRHDNYDRGMFSFSTGIWRPHFSRKLKNRLINNGLMPDHFGQITTDPGCVEVPSPVLKSWDQAYEWYTGLTEHAEAVGLTTFHPEQAGGGGHIHTGGLTSAQKYQIIHETAFRPYLSWVGISSGDTKNAGNLFVKSPWRVSAILFALRKACKTTKVRGALEKRLDRLDIGITREVLLQINTGYDTLEWRAFDSAADWSIQVCHLAFVQRYYDYCLKTFNPSPTPDCMLLFLESATDFDVALREFKDLVVNKLCLPWSEYEWMVERNLRPRMESEDLAYNLRFQSFIHEKELSTSL